MLSRLHRALEAPLVCVAADEAAAEHLAADLAFFLGGRGAPERPNVVVMPADEVLPFDEVSPDAATVSERLGALFHLSRATPFAALVLSRRMLMRRSSWLSSRPGIPIWLMLMLPPIGMPPAMMPAASTPGARRIVSRISSYCCARSGAVAPADDRLSRG